MIPSSKQISNKILQQCIRPVFEEATACISGQSFVVGNHLITAAHVVSELDRPYVFLNGKKYRLHKDEAYCFKHIPSNNIDCAIFTLPYEILSPLQWGNVENISDKLTCFYVGYEHDSSDGSVKMQLKSSEAHIISVDENAFICDVEPMLKCGYSGGPIVCDEKKIVGMLVCGDDKHVCGFQRGQFISDLIANAKKT